MALPLLLCATVLAAVSGLAGWLSSPGSARGQRIAVGLMLGASAMGLGGAGLILYGSHEAPQRATWWLMSEDLIVAADVLSAYFLALIFLIGGVGAVYGLGYWPAKNHIETSRRVCLFWGTMVAGMALLVLARHAMAFLLGWEIMAFSAFLLIATEDQEQPVRQAAWLYLISTHVGTLSLFAMFVLLRQVTGSWELVPIRVDQAGLGLLSAIFFLALIGFGLKAGLMPLHFWLPSAHASAPSHVSALMSGVVIKMGVYGLVRFTGFMPEPPLIWGGILFILGAVSGVLGVVLALAQKDLKRLLAYSSVENVGIIAMGLGLALAGRSLNRPTWVVLGLGGALLHVWNHGLFKPLLFLSCGSVVHATGTREIDRLGGLARAMPWTAGLFFVGALAICAFPALNGFVGELLIYLGLFATVGSDGGAAWLGAAVGAPVLALIGALAVACFVKFYGVVFLGRPRSSATDGAHEAPRSMLAPMVLLAGGCVTIGVAPILVTPVLDACLAVWTGSHIAGLPRVATLAPLTELSAVGVALLVITGLVLVWVRRSVRIAGVESAPTWGCGYAQPNVRMQYTGSSFTQFLVHLMSRLIKPIRRRPHLPEPFCGPSEFNSQVDDGVLDRRIVPALRRIDRWMKPLHYIQHGLTQHYVLYILATVVVLMAWSLPIKQFMEQLFAR